MDLMNGQKKKNLIESFSRKLLPVTVSGNGIAYSSSHPNFSKRLENFFLDSSTEVENIQWGIGFLLFDLLTTRRVLNLRSKIAASLLPCLGFPLMSWVLFWKISFSIGAAAKVESARLFWLELGPMWTLGMRRSRSIPKPAVLNVPFVPLKVVPGAVFNFQKWRGVFWRKMLVPTTAQCWSVAVSAPVELGRL